jgi:ketosteroid isomerase-like protein
MSKFKQAAFVVMVLLMVVACAPAAETPAEAPAPDYAAQTAELLAGVNEWFDLYNAGDAEGVTALHADDAVVMPAGAPTVTGREAILAFLSADIANTQAAGLTFVGAPVTDGGVDGDTAWTSGQFSLTDESGATVVTGKYLTVYRRAGDGWLITRDIWNMDGDGEAEGEEDPAEGEAPAAD